MTNMQGNIYKIMKTTNAKRKVFMPEALNNYLYDLYLKRKEDEIVYSAQREQNEKMIVNIDGKKISSLELINTQPNGRIQTEWAIKHHARPLREQYNILFKFHNLRHTYGTNLALMNTPAHILSNQMGHSKSSTTHKYYLAISKEGIETLKENLNKF